MVKNQKCVFPRIKIFYLLEKKWSYRNLVNSLLNFSLLFFPSSFLTKHTSVRHSHDNGLDAELGGLVDDLFHGRDEDLAPLQPETLL